MGTQIVERKANEDPATMGEPPRSLSFAAAGPPMVYSYCLLVQYGCWGDIHTTVLTVLEISKGLGWVCHQQPIPWGFLHIHTHRLEVKNANSWSLPEFLSIKANT